MSQDSRVKKAVDGLQSGEITFPEALTIVAMCEHSVARAFEIVDGQVMDEKTACHTLLKVR